MMNEELADHRRLGLLLPEILLFILSLKFAGSNAIFSDNPPVEVSYGDNFSHWMENLPTSLHNVPLTSLAIPGSHDSCSYSISRKSQFAVKDKKARSILRDIDDAPAKDIVYRWSVTQSLNITEQLKLGIRYLDIRVSYNTSNEKWYVFHGLFGDIFENVVKQIALFVKRSPKEVIVMDINHMNVDKKYERLPFDTKSFQDQDNWIAFLTTHYNKQRPSNMFYITQGIMQLHWAEIITGIAVNATLKSWLAETANPILVDWLKTRENGPNGINIVIADFVESDNYVSTVLALNNRSSSSTVASSIPKVLLITLITLLQHFSSY